MTNLLDSGFNQEYSYDHMGRLSASTSGTKVNSQNQTVTPFAQTLGYNAFGDLTVRTTDVWGGATADLRRLTRTAARTIRTRSTMRPGM